MSIKIFNHSYIFSIIFLSTWLISMGDIPPYTMPSVHLIDHFPIHYFLLFNQKSLMKKSFIKTPS